MHSTNNFNVVKKLKFNKKNIDCSIFVFKLNRKCFFFFPYTDDQFKYFYEQKLLPMKIEIR